MYNEIVQVNSPDKTTKNAHGQYDLHDSTNWSTYCKSYARLKTLKGDEFNQAGQNDSRVNATFFLPYSIKAAAIDSTMRVVHQSRTYEIRYCNPTVDGLQSQVEIGCERVAD